MPFMVNMDNYLKFIALLGFTLLNCGLNAAHKYRNQLVHFAYNWKDGILE